MSNIKPAYELSDDKTELTVRITLPLVGERSKRKKMNGRTVQELCEKKGYKISHVVVNDTCHNYLDEKSASGTWVFKVESNSPAKPSIKAPAKRKLK